MATKFLSFDETVAKLGIEPEALQDLQRRQEIIGYRDGGTWKFKADDVEAMIEKFASSSGVHDEDLPFGLGGELGSDLGGPSPSSTGSDISMGEDIVLLSEVELGGSGPSPSSTVIGQSLPGGGKESLSDLKLKQNTSAAMSDVKLADSDVKPGGSTVDLTGSAILSGSSGASSAGKSDVLPVDMESGDAPTSDLNLGGGSDLGGSDLRLVGSNLELLGGSSDLKLDEGSSEGSALDLGEEESADVLGGSSGPGSDITHRPSDSGILLIDPADSGLSLDQVPLDLAGSGSGGSDKKGSDFDSTELKADDDFLLTPLEEAGDDDTDSGSQVIMLDTEGEFDEATATLLQSRGGLEGGIAPDLLEAESPLAGIGGPISRSTPRVETQVVTVSDLPFSGLSVVGLALSAVLLIFTGFMMYDIVRNMWSWDTPYNINSSIMDTILSK